MSLSIDQMRAAVEQQLAALELNGNPPELYQPIRYILDLGGKRLRPLLVLLSYNLFKDDPLTVVSEANLVEVFHNFTLMHDDIMDDAPLRRGQQTVHEKWDTNIGILSGDLMMVKAYQLLENLPASKMANALKAFNQCAAEVCEGQQVDMNFESQDGVTEEEYLDMIRQKTPVLLGFCMEFGALLADATPVEQKAAYEFGVNIGLGFQLMDDLLDVYGDQHKFGKQVGGDIVANKKTFLLIKALEQAQGENHGQLKHWLSLQEFDKTEKVDAVRSIYDQLQIKAQVESKMNQYFDLAYDQLESLPARPGATDQLKTFTDYLINRDR
jgi:geranylgeranyl diphosphate synthase type II